MIIYLAEYFAIFSICVLYLFYSFSWLLLNCIILMITLYLLWLINHNLVIYFSGCFRIYCIPLYHSIPSSDIHTTHVENLKLYVHYVPTILVVVLLSYILLLYNLVISYYSCLTWFILFYFIFWFILKNR